MKAIVLLPLLSGCATTVTRIAHDCKTDSRPFPEAGECQKPRLVTQIQAPDDIKALYLAIGDQIAQRVRQDELSDNDARFLMAVAYREAVWLAANPY